MTQIILFKCSSLLQNLESLVLAFVWDTLTYTLLQTKHNPKAKAFSQNSSFPSIKQRTLHNSKMAQGQLEEHNKKPKALIQPPDSPDPKLREIQLNVPEQA